LISLRASRSLFFGKIPGAQFCYGHNTAGSISVNFRKFNDLIENRTHDLLAGRINLLVTDYIQLILEKYFNLINAILNKFLTYS
jgi:hypothetical protein